MHRRLLLVAIQLLTRLPVGDPLREARDLARGVGWFGIVGAAIGGVAAFVWWSASIALPRGAAATLAVLTLVVVTGGLHEDGLADTADGVFGGSDPDSRLQIMRDPRIGTYGVLALVVAVLLRVWLLAALSPVAGAAALVVVSSLSRGMMALGLVDAAPAAPDGSGARLLDHLTPWPPMIAAGTALVATALFAGVATPAVVAAAAVAVVLVRRSAVQRIGGLTGDVMGAMVITAEVAALAVLVGLEVGSGL